MQYDDDKTMEIGHEIFIKNEANETLVCTKICVPTSMRSYLWKYFGFPSDNFNNILTRKKIICSLCLTIICYNKNTSNLRTHLVAKHQDIYIKLNEEIKQISTSKKQKISGAIITKPESDSYEKQELELVKPSDLNFIEIDNNDEYITTRNEQYDDYPDNFVIEEIEDRQIEIMNDQRNEENIDSHIVSAIKNIDLINFISEMLINDLLSPKTISGKGFLGLMQQLHNNFTEVTVEEVETNIEEIYLSKFKITTQIIKKVSNEATYCLGLEIFNNFEQKKLLNIYFIHTSYDNGYGLKNFFYKTVELNSHIHYPQLFSDLNLNLSNCSAFVMSESNESIENFANDKGISTVISVDKVLANIVNKVFQIDSIQGILTSCKILIDRKTPDMDERYSWSKYNFLKYMYEKNLSNQPINQIIELLNPLQIILETIADETPYSSLIKPLSEQLLNQSYNIKETDEKLEVEIKTVIQKELTEKILSNKFLIQTSFLDPRFQHFLNTNDRNLTKTIILDKLKLINDKTVIKSEVKVTTINNNRKSSLKSFFNQSNNNRNLQTPSKSQIEMELDKYLNEIAIDLEDCPIRWWNNNYYLYKNLKNYSMKYFCVPCNINNLFKLKIEDEITLLNNRFMLNEKYINILWFLHMNCENNLQ